jgi:hypothetical protein
LYRKTVGGEEDLTGFVQAQGHRIGLYIQTGILQMTGEEIFDQFPHEAPTITMGQGDMGVLHLIVGDCC